MGIALGNICTTGPDFLRIPPAPRTDLLTLTMFRHASTMAKGTAKVQAEPKECEQGLAMAAKAHQELGGGALQSLPE